MNQNFTQYTFSETVKQLQERDGSRRNYSLMENSGDRYVLTPQEVEFIESRDHFYLSTVGPNGWPYVQYRGGPKGFLKALGPSTIGFADFRGNRQHISSGNIMDTGKVAMILMDYPTRQRVKIWAEAKVSFAEEEPALVETLSSKDYRARVERIYQFEIKAYDWNCPQHIFPRFTVDELLANPGLLKQINTLAENSAAEVSR
ncbi:MAG: pyridoxamine 5'-phosphate oxidase family protein [Opitutales bacterium]